MGLIKRGLRDTFFRQNMKNVFPGGLKDVEYEFLFFEGLSIYIRFVLLQHFFSTQFSQSSKETKLRDYSDISVFFACWKSLRQFSFVKKDSVGHYSINETIELREDDKGNNDLMRSKGMFVT